MKHIILIATLLISSASARTVNVTASNLRSALVAAQAGDTLLLARGTYPIAYTAGAKNTMNLSQSGTASNPIVVKAPGHGSAVLDFSFPEGQWVQDSYGLFVTGSYWIFEGISVTRAGYQGAYVTGAHNTFRNCAFYNNRNTGLEINKGGSYTLVERCDAYRNYDPKKSGTMADGFGPKETQGAGNRFVNCRAWENSDDGFDTYNSAEAVIFEDSWAFRNGVDVWGYGAVGNGNGFKVGGNFKQQNNILVRCIAFANPLKGFDQNNNTGGLTIVQSLAFANGTNFGLGNDVNDGQRHSLSNNISLSGKSSDNISNADQRTNSWNLGTAKASDFMSIDTSLARAPRNDQGVFHSAGLFLLTNTSPWLNVGTVLQYDYAGTKPDLGPFELHEDIPVAIFNKITSARSGSTAIDARARALALPRDILGRLHIKHAGLVEAQ